MRLRFDKRDKTSKWLAPTVYVVCVLLSFVISGLVLAALKINPIVFFPHRAARLLCFAVLRLVLFCVRLEFCFGAV